MQLTNTPAKLVLPFANAGAKNTIPTASQIGITAGAASLVDGFPPLTRTPIAAGGVPPSGLDMNGILFELSAILRWANAGGGYAFDGTFAADSNVGGYPKGARIMRSDGLGYWFNTVENNTTDPENTGAGVAAAAGWVPDYTNGVTTVAMASANVTLTPVQYGKPVIVITGALTANLNLIFPNIVNEWTVINNTSGAYTITCKTAAGTGLVVNTAALIVGDGTNIQSVITDAAALFGETVSTATGGTADAITATFAPVPRYPSNGVCLSVRAASANATTTPTFTPNSGVIAAATIVKGNNLPLAVGDIAGAGHWLELAWDSTLTKWVLLNPATGVTSVSSFGFKNRIKNGAANIDQRYAYVATTIVAGYVNDRWYYENTQSGTVACAGGVIVAAPPGYKYSCGMYVNSGNTAPGAADRLRIAQRIEGYDVMDLAFGTASAKAVTLSFWVTAGTAGTYGVGLVNAAANRSYVATYAVNSANTWEYKTITIPGDTSGTWAINNTCGIEVNFDYGSGSNYEAAAGAWGATRSWRTSACVKLGSVTPANSAFRITGIQLESGSTASAFDPRPLGVEFALCQRYRNQTYSFGVAPATATNVGAQVMCATGANVNYASGTYKHPVSMRAIPTTTFYSPNNGATGNWYRSSGLANVAVVASGNGTASTESVSYTNNAAVTTSEQIYGHIVNDAEI